MLEASPLVTEPVTSSTSLYWMSQIIDTPPERLLKATQQLTQEHSGYLTLGHLKSAVDAHKPLSKAHRPFPVLPNKPADREVAKKHIADIKKMLAS